ncbi:MAG TPA: hypothetical protein H9903_00675 [Candidatus Aquabacterium excrementipullorum]|nr:hypothetical protein [Candidatus Aquabacterium excrementipullorum]
MSNDDLHIARLHGHLRSAHPLSEQDLRRWRETVQEAGMPDFGVDVTDPEEWLLIRHLDVAMHWRPDGPRAEAGQDWTQALQHAVRALMTHPEHPDLVRYRGRRQGLSDLIYRSALGETHRQWAWRRMGWLDGTEMSPQRALAQGLAHLRAQPGWVWPLLRQWVAAEPSTGVLTALLRAVPVSEWQAWLGTCMASRGYAVLQWRGGPAHQRAGWQAHVADSDHGHALAATQDHPVWPALNTDAQVLSGWLAARPWLATSHGEVLAVLMAAVAWPDQGSGIGLLRQRLDAAWHVVWGTSVASPAALWRDRDAGDGPAPSASASSPNQVASRLHDAPIDIVHVNTDHLGALDAELPPAPALPDSEFWQPTQWAGALFWLRALEAPGLLEELMGPTPGEGVDARGHALAALATALGVPAQDAALRAFVGGVLPQGQPQPGMAQAAQSQAARWGAWLDEVAPELAEPRLRTVCQRPGHLRFEPGWIELHLSLDQVDTRIRRLGLDLDAGYLPWLGCVLRIRYE